MELYVNGCFAKSTAGHDKEEIYVIIREEKEYVYLCNGSTRKIDNPKRKNKKHVQPVKGRYIDYLGQTDNAEFSDEAVRKAIRHYIGG